MELNRMATSATVNGVITLPNDANPDQADIIFTLSSFGLDGGIVLHTPVKTEISAADGSFSIDLWPNSADSQGTFYTVSVSYYEDAPYKRDNRKIYPLGVINVPSGGAVDIEDLFFDLPIPEPTTEEILAALAAAETAATAAAVTATAAASSATAAAATVMASFPTEAALTADETGYSNGTYAIVGGNIRIQADSTLTGGDIHYTSKEGTVKWKEAGAYFTSKDRLKVGDNDVGANLYAEGFTYEVVASDPDITDADGGFIRVVPMEDGAYPLEAFDTSDNSAALASALSRGAVVAKAGKTYTFETGVVVTDQDVVIHGNGARFERSEAGEDAPVLEVINTMTAKEDLADVTLSLEDVWLDRPQTKLDRGSALDWDDGDTVTLMGTTYTFVSSLSTANDVLIDGTLDGSMDNLVAAVNGEAGEGTTYGTGTTVNLDFSGRRGGSSDPDIINFTSKKWLLPDSVYAVAVSDADGTAEITRLYVMQKTSRIRITDAAAATLGGVNTGDTFRIISDDLIPWARAENNQRLGMSLEAAGVHSSGGNTDIYTAKPIELHNALTTNIRLAKYSNYKTDIRDVTFSDGEDFNKDISQSLLRLQGTVQHNLEGLTCDYSAGSFVETQACHRPRSNDLRGEELAVRFAEYEYGYGLVEYGSTQSYHTNMEGRHCRHVYTTGARGISDPTASEAYDFGGCVGCVVDGGIGDDCGNAAFDEHEDALNTQLLNVTVRQGHAGQMGNLYGVQLRGQGSTVTGTVEGQRCLTIGVYGTGTGNHYFDLVYKRPDRGEGDTGDSVRIRNYSTQDARMRGKIVASLDGNTFGGSLMFLDGDAGENGADMDLHFYDVDVTSEPADDAATIFELASCKVAVDRGSWDMQNAAGVNPSIVRMHSDAGRIEVGDFITRNEPSDWRICDLNEKVYQDVYFQRLVCDRAPDVASQTNQSDIFDNRVFRQKFTSGSTAIVADDTVVGDTSGYRGTALYDATVTSGSWAGGDAAGYVTLVNMTGDLEDGEPLEVSSVDVATADGDTIYSPAFAAVELSGSAKISGATPPSTISYSSSSGSAATINWQGRSDKELLLRMSNGNGSDRNVFIISPPAFNGQILRAHLLSTTTSNFTFLASGGKNLNIPDNITLTAGDTAVFIGNAGEWING